MADEFIYEGRPIPARPGQSIAAALWEAGIRSWRTTRYGAPRGLFCGIGACFDCLATVDGVQGQRLCLAEARPGTVVTRDGGIPAAEPAVRRAASTPAERAPAPRYDVAVVGAGPAGLAAAATAGLAGASVALLDSARHPGGQYWRHRSDTPPGGRDGRVYAGLASIVEERVELHTGAAVWLAEPGFALHLADGRRIQASRMVLATGAYDRVYPFPGWHLPGVVTAGAAQALLKGSGTVVGRSVVVAGAGPFLLPVAVGLAEAGARVVGVFEAGDPREYLRRIAAIGGAAARLREAAGYLAALARRRIPYRARHAVLAAHGDDRVESVTVSAIDPEGEPVPGSRRVLACDALAIGYGFVANLELPLSLGCATGLGADGGLAVMVDADGQTSVPGVYAAGEVTGVGGAALAIVEGELAGAAVAAAAGLPAPFSSRGLASLRRRRARLAAFAEAMHRAHTRPAGWREWVGNQTLVCRCEEVSVAQVTSAVTELGAGDGRSVKLLARPGMGWCQGRVCGTATAELTAALTGRSVRPEDLLAFAHRPLAVPVPLRELAEPEGD